MNLEDIMNQLGVEKYDVIQLITVLSVINGMKNEGKDVAKLYRQLITHMKVVRGVLTGEIMAAEEEMAR